MNNKFPFVTDYIELVEKGSKDLCDAYTELKDLQYEYFRMQLQADTYYPKSDYEFFLREKERIDFQIKIVQLKIVEAYMEMMDKPFPDYPFDADALPFL